jgi:DNA-binding transcriptional MocR family regulator
MSWTPDLRGAQGPIYLALADAIGKAIAAGELLDGARLPTQRELAQKLGVDLTTVTRAYAEAQRAGFIVSDGRRGSFVRGRAKRTSPLNAARGLPASTVNLDQLDIASVEAPDLAMPPEPPGGMLQSAIRDAMETILVRQGFLPLQYQPSGGTAFDRLARAEMMSAVGPTHPDQIVITAGGQNAIHAICTAMLQPGDRVACGGFVYPGFLAVARRIGARIAPLAMDEDGVIPESLEDVLRDGPIKALFVVPTNDNPTTATLPAQRRNRLAELAEQHDFSIIEDDAFGASTGYAVLPIVNYAPSRTWYLSSVSKAITPGLRVATVRAPSIRHAFALAADVRETAVMAPPLSVALLTQWIVDGTLPKLVRAVTMESAARLQLAREILGGHNFRAQPQGFHLWISRPDAEPGTEPPPSAMLAGLPVVPASTFAVAPTGREQSLRVSLGGLRTRERLASDLGRLDAALALADRRRS